MSGCGIRKDIAEQLKNKQTAASIDAITTAEVECSHTSGTSTRAAAIDQGNDVLSSQMQHSELLLRNAERLKQTQ